MENNSFDTFEQRHHDAKKTLEKMAASKTPTIHEAARLNKHIDECEECASCASTLIYKE